MEQGGGDSPVIDLNLVLALMTVKGVSPGVREHFLLSNVMVHVPGSA